MTQPRLPGMPEPLTRAEKAWNRWRKARDARLRVGRMLEARQKRHAAKAGAPDREAVG